VTERVKGGIAMSMDENPTRAPEEPATKEVAELQPSGTPVITADLDDRTEILDAVAGSEFVDDRIRLQE
jgi:hypothetical protein